MSDNFSKEEEEEAGGRRKGGPTGTPKLGVDVPTGPTGSGVSGARHRRKHRRWCGVPLHRRGRGGLGLVLSSHDRSGGSYKRMNGVGKG